MAPLGIYVHFPFCRAKCHYCDFNSVVAAEPLRSAYLDALREEISRQPRCRAATIYFGGGTPTIYPPEDLSRILGAVLEHFDLDADAEVTCEANPGTVSAESLRHLQAAGFNRLSLGVQSLRDEELRLLGRVHTATEARAAVALARAAGFDNLSLDLIRGLPGQTLAHWQESLEAALALAPDHISVYGLELEPGTLLHDRVTRGVLPKPDDESQPEWIAWTVERLAAEGYQRYEISNYARPGYECRHNLSCWQQGEYLGLGAGAWSYVDGERRCNLAAPDEYLRAVAAGASLVAQSERLDRQAALGEAIMLGLRTSRGVSRRELAARFGVDIHKKHSALIARLVAAGLADDDPEYLRLTPAGMLVYNAVAAEFL